MSCPMVTWCVAGSAATTTEIKTSRTSRRGCMEMASQDSVFGSTVPISHAPISLTPIGVRLSPTQVPFRPCVGRSRTEKRGPNCWQSCGPNRGTRLPCRPRQDILKHLVKQHGLNPSQALAVRQVLDESCITALTGGAGTGKSETLVACIKAVLWQQGLLVAQNPEPADRSTWNMGRKVGGPESHTQPRACVLVTAPTNAQVDMLLARVHEECYKDSVFREKVLGEHPAPWLRLRAQRATAPTGLAPFDQEEVQKTLGKTPGCKPTLKCALNSCRVLFATARMVANRHKMLLGKGQEKTRFAFSFVDEASRHSIPVGLDLAAMGSQCLLCGDPGQLRPYSHVQLLASWCEAEGLDVVPERVAWPRANTFKFNGVVMDGPGPEVHWHDSHRFCTTSTLQFFLYRTRCRASILVQQYRMT